MLIFITEMRAYWAESYYISHSKSVVQTSLIERDLRIRPSSLWAGGGGETHDWNHKLVIWRHCNTVVIVIMDWSVKTTGLLSKVTTENGLGHSTMAYTTAVLPGGLWQKESWLSVPVCEVYLFSMWHLCAGRSVNVVQFTGVTVMGKAAEMRWGCLL